ncbi:Gfo/Idh/MocA family oxidoreductase [Mucilaginibacter mali]|uniref:Gfo/Idh/MocA family oxidoreductase n=1 Tax=Mucilaginibacter mali TaxID=2740462 RepID=A0A7D4QIR8_9SPHI|nr:Gfo/Idh/MocA family oxidoreductase [Mucilaginibacter mali]QKJ32852.1 Gfo/Idh/MocA family oxidoreductase [Mucilaginibacter mali]
MIKNNENKKSIKWGIIGCGNVTEVKSGPAFNEVPHSKLVAVMRRNAALAADYARRHKVSKWYSQAEELIADPEVNAIYVATPPAYHEEYVIKALEYGKMVYVEKPVTTTVESCERMVEAEHAFRGKLCVAHYRRALPYFNGIKGMLDQGTIGKVKMVKLTMLQPYRNDLIAKTEYNWRVVPALSGGGLFFDLAPHQLDILMWMLGEPVSCQGISLNHAGLYEADDTVVGTIQFPNGVLFTGDWCFTVPNHLKQDRCEIIGEKGAIKFEMFGKRFTVKTEDGIESFDYDHPRHIQQPMIGKVVNYFLGNGLNPCSANDALKSLQVMEAFQRKNEKDFKFIEL